MYKDILFPIDIADEGSWKQSLPVVKDHIAAFGSRLHVMCVVPDFGMSIVSQYFPNNAEEKVIEGTKTALHDFTKKHFPGHEKIHHIVSQGTVYEAIIDAAKRINADLIIMGAHRPELKDYLLGPNAARVVRHSDRSVLVVRD